MFGASKVRGVFAGRAVGKGGISGVFSTVTGPGLGVTRAMDRAIFDKAVTSANRTLREVRESSEPKEDGPRS